MFFVLDKECPVLESIDGNPTREEVLLHISKSSSYGNLGLFVGAGFSKAVMNRKHDEVALSWGQLLVLVSKQMGVSYKEKAFSGIGYPEIASIICQRYSVENDCSYQKSVTILKREVASLTGWYPNKKSRDIYSKYFEALDPKWIITTNYDLIIESLLTGKSVTLGPEDSLSSPQDLIPVYHLHGVRSNPDGIVICQEDYVALFRPNEYRQIKLALTIKESTTVLIGYGLGDVNVLTAIDWSKNVFSEGNANYPNDVIQLLHSHNPKEQPYRDNNGILVVELSDLKSFFESFLVSHERRMEKVEKSRSVIKKLIEEFSDPSSDLVDRFIDDSEFRENTLRKFGSFPAGLKSGFIVFLQRCIDVTWKRAEPRGAFEAYNENLTMILDVLVFLKMDGIPPALFETCAYEIERVAYFVDEKFGKSKSANKTFESRKSELSEEMVAELWRFSEQHNYIDLRGLLERIKR